MLSGTKSADINTVAIQDLLSNRILNATRKTSPSTSSENRVCDTLSFGSKKNGGDTKKSKITYKRKVCE